MARRTKRPRRRRLASRPSLIDRMGPWHWGLLVMVVVPGVALALGLSRVDHQRSLERRERASQATQERAFFEADFSRRFAEDPDFRDKMTREAVQAAQAEGAAIRAGKRRKRERYLGE